MKITTTLFAMFLSLVTVHCLHADLLLDLRLDDTTRTRTVTTGDSVFVDLFLVDTDGTSVMSANGLIGGGGRIFDVPTGAAATGSLTSAGAGFTGPSASPPGAGIASAEVSALFLSFVPAGAAGAGVTTAAMAGATEILLARFQVTANGGDGDTHTLTAGPLGAPSSGNVANGFPPTPLDGFLTASGPAESITLTVSAAAVPEPSSLMFAAILGGAFFVRRRRKSEVSNVA